MKNNSVHVTRVLTSPTEVDAAQWNALLAQQSEPSPFMRHEYLAALHTSGSASPQTGWTPRFITLWLHDELQAACPLYLKDHSYGEYVFDFAWANAYQQHGLPYYPKALIAVPFTPVPGSRLLARDEAARTALIRAVIAWCEDEQLSSLHLLFGSELDIAACEQAGLMTRNTVQFHWKNEMPVIPADAVTVIPADAVTVIPADAVTVIPAQAVTVIPAQAVTVIPAQAGIQSALPMLSDPNTSRLDSRLRGNDKREATKPFSSFDDFLATLTQDKRKKIKQERRKVADAGVSFRWALGADITPEDWAFFYRCYERTYLEHGNAPYLSRDFFKNMATGMPENWLMFTAEREGQSIATSLIATRPINTWADGRFDLKTAPVAYGRYWGALQRVDCLHFEACYYQPLQWCINHGYARFEGGAQGEHKMARALMPVPTTSAHWLAHPAFADAVQRFLEREGDGVVGYLEHLGERSPFKAA